jgi:hypothetical protein
MSRRFKLIVTDLDDTLLRGNKTVSVYSSRILQDCLDAGLFVAYATARPMRSTDYLAASFLPKICIYHNGAVIRHHDGSFEHMGIEHQALSAMIASIQSRFPGCELAAESNDRIYANFDVGKLWTGLPYTKTEFESIPFTVADKFIVNLNDDNEEIEALKACLPSGVYLEMSKDKVGMIMNREATKINAIRKICIREHIELGEVVCFGDDSNDLEMIRQCGLGVAVANAKEDVLSVADESASEIV